MAISVSSQILGSVHEAQKLVYSFNGNLLDKIVYNFPKDIVYESSFYELNDSIYRVSNISKKIYEKNNIPDRYRQIFIGISNTDYSDNDGENIRINLVKVKFLNDDELASLLSHEIAHKLCGHSELIEELISIHSVLNKEYHDNDNSFIFGVRRVFELEADKVGIYLAKNAGYDEFAYKTELGKFEPQPVTDIEEYNIFSSHPSIFDRLKFLDSIDFSNYQFDIKKAEKRVSDIKKAISLSDKANIEAYYYEKVGTLFAYESANIKNRIDKINFLSNERKFQYQRALSTLESTLKNIISNPKFYVSYRELPLKQFLKNRDFINQAKFELQKNLNKTTKLKIIFKNSLNKTKETFNEWTR